MNKYGFRSLPTITRNQPDSNTVAHDDMSIEFLRQLHKQSVQPKAEVQTLYDQMHSIINGTKPRYPSVEAAVRDMLDRTGLTTYKQQLRAQKDPSSPAHTKQAEIKVELFQQVPQVKQTIDNYIASTHGNLFVPEILDQVRNIHKNDVADYAIWGSPALLTYINEKNIAEKKMHPDAQNIDQDLGKVDFNDEDTDPSNTDALHALNPATVNK